MESAVERVSGTMTNRSGDQWPVPLDLSLERLPNTEIEKEVLTGVKLIADTIPDGYYVLEFPKPVDRHVRIVNGKLLIRGVE